MDALDLLLGLGQYTTDNEYAAESTPLQRVNRRMRMDKYEQERPDVLEQARAKNRARMKADDERKRLDEAILSGQPRVNQGFWYEQPFTNLASYDPVMQPGPPGMPMRWSVPEDLSFQTGQAMPQMPQGTIRGSRLPANIGPDLQDTLLDQSLQERQPPSLWAKAQRELEQPGPAAPFAELTRLFQRINPIYWAKQRIAESPAVQQAIKASRHEAADFPPGSTKQQYANPIEVLLRLLAAANQRPMQGMW